MQCDVGTSTLADPAAAIAEAMAQISARRSDRPGFVALHCSANYDITALRKAAATRVGGPIHGGTSCKGIMSHHGSLTETGQSLGIFALWDDAGDFGTAAEPFEDNIRGASRAAAERAILRAGRLGESPDLVWLSTAPGHEEEVLDGIREIVGDNVAIVGGSVADDTVSGDWAVFDDAGVLNQGVVVSALFLSGHQANMFQSGYSPTSRSGRVTSVQDRQIFEIDGKPAAEVYHHWTSGAALPNGPTTPGSILVEAAQWPLGRNLLRRDGYNDQLLVHPVAVGSDGSIGVFADVPEGSVLTQMHGSQDALVDRAGQVAQMSASALRQAGSRAEGALVVYCGGGMMCVEDRLNEVVDSVRAALPDVPFLGIFTFGEQGRLPDSGNLHGNLMISCITFGS